MTMMKRRGGQAMKLDNGSQPFCPCWHEKAPVKWQELDVCNCGEEVDLVEWRWQSPQMNTLSQVAMSGDQKQVTFHPFYSSGTAAVRGDAPMIHNYHYYWEVKMLSETYGTDIMVGVGTAKVNMPESQYRFTSLLGLDTESYGLSYTGPVKHNGMEMRSSVGFCRGSIVGVRLDMWEGTLEFYINREPQGIAFYNLRRHNMLYPMLSSTAAQSSLRLIYASSWRASLLVDAARMLATTVKNDMKLHLPPGLWHILKSQFWLTLPTEGCVSEENDNENENEPAVKQKMKRVPTVLTEILNSQYMNGFYVDNVDRDHRIVREPTIVGVANFNAAEDAATLRAAMKGFGTDEQAIIDILTTRSNSQRQAISKAFTHEYGRDLIEDLKSELGGNFEDVIVALMLPPEEYLCKELNKCMEGLGTDEHVLIEILCTRTKKEIADIVQAYERLYDRPLAEHMCSETSGDFRRLLTLIVTAAPQGARDEEAAVEPARAADSAQRLYDAGEAKWGTDEEVFNKILAHESFAQLRLIFEEYKNISGRTIEQAIKAEVDGELKEAYSAIVECVENAAAWFAQRLRAAMQGAGTEDGCLVRVITSRAEIDLASIKQEYERMYDKTLRSDLEQGETSGDYKRALVALLGPA